MENVDVCVKTYKFSRLKAYVSSCLILCYLFFAVFMPADNLMIKKVFYIAAFGVNLFLIENALLSGKCHKSLMLWGIAFPLFLSINSVLTGGHLKESISMVWYFTTLLLLIPINKYGIDYEKMLVYVLLFLAAVIIMCFLLDFAEAVDIYDNPFLMYLYGTGNALVGKSPLYPVYYIIFIKSAPLLLAPLLYFLNRENYFPALISLFALILSGTRADIFVGIFAVCSFFSLSCSSKRGKAVFYALALLLVYLYGASAAEKIMTIFQNKASSDAVRLGHYASIIDVLSDPVNLIFGTGFGTEFFSLGRMDVVSITELSYLEFIRTCGLAGFIPFAAFLLWPLYRLFFNKKTRYIAITYGGYLVIAATNPLLLNTTAFLMYLYIYDVCLYKIEKRSSALA